MPLFQYPEKRGHRWCSKCQALVEWQRVRELGQKQSRRACVYCGRRTLPAWFGNAGARQRRRTDRQKQQELLDTRAGALVKARDGFRCTDCGNPNRAELQWAHLVTRKRHPIRWDPENATTLCARCHVKWTLQQTAWVDYASARMGDDRWAALIVRSRAGQRKTDLDAWEGLLRMYEALVDTVHEDQIPRPW